MNFYFEPEILPNNSCSFYQCGTCNSIILKQKHVLALVQFGSDKCIVVKPEQNLKKLLVSISDQTKI